MIWTAFLLGLVGSLHCVGMCGAIALALPHNGRGWTSFVAGRVAYNLGRVATYSALGLVFGFIGRSLAFAGVQRWLSIGAGAAILAGLLVSRRFTTPPIVRAVGWLKVRLATLLRSRSFGSLALLGILNGLLPCGLVYAAAAGAAATGDVLSGVAYMALFGLGTVPLMMAVSLSGKAVVGKIGFSLRRLIPASLILVATLLILRGMALGIPYLSPAEAACCCHASRGQ